MDFRRSCFSFGDALVEGVLTKGWNFGFGFFSVSGKKVVGSLKKMVKNWSGWKGGKGQFPAMIFEELLDGLVGCFKKQ